MSMRIKYDYVSAGNHPQLGFKIFYRRRKAIDGERRDRYQRYMCDTLNAVAQTRDDCDRLLGYIESISNGNKLEMVCGGNDVTLTMTKSGVQVDIEINDDWIGKPEGRFSLNEWKVALTEWKRFLEMPRCLNSVVEFEL